MSTAHLSHETLDDLMRAVFEVVRSDGREIEPRRGPATEVMGILLELSNPRARLSRTEARGKVFSSLGELCWYLSGSADISFMEHYVSSYREYVTLDGEEVVGAYGPRLRAWGGVDQLMNVVQRLDSADTRRAVIQLFDRGDLKAKTGDAPCTLTLHFMLRDGRVNALVSMRSNDAVRGLPHDAFCFTMLQELIARSMGADVGWYRHVVGSLHIYEEDREAVDRFMGEGWQSTKSPMPPMPSGDPWPAVGELLAIEKRIREGAPVDVTRVQNVGEYWADLARLLLIHAHLKEGNLAEASSVQGQLASQVYDAFVDGKLK